MPKQKPFHDAMGISCLSVMCSSAHIARRFKEAWDGIVMRMILKSEENERTVEKESKASEREEKRVTGEMDLEQIHKK